MYCDVYPNIHYFIFTSAIPSLFYYAHIPVLFISLMLGIFVLSKDRKARLNQIFFSITLFFSLWIVLDFINWLNPDSRIILVSWALQGTLFPFISALCVCFVLVYILRKIPKISKWILLLSLVPAVIIMPTNFNLSAFDITVCNATESPFIIYYKFLYGLFAFLWILGIGIYYYMKSLEMISKRQIVLLIAGIEAFLLSFFTATFIASYLIALGVISDFTLEQYGLFGMVAFMAFLTFIIVRYHAFNIKLIGAQALIVSLVILIGSEFFFIQSNTNRILTALTLIITGAIGLNLIRSVKKEVAQREHIEMLAGELQETNRRQETMMHFIGHEVKGFLTKDAGAFAALVEGDFGQCDVNMKPFVENALKQSRDGARSVTDILLASNQKKGTMTYAKEPFDLKTVIAEVIGKERAMAREKNLTLTFSADESGASYTVSGDKAKIGDNVFRNIIENSIHYTPTGSITATLKKDTGKYIFAIKDTGIGINAEDMQRLFTEGGHGKDSQKVNVHSTGYGLFIAKNVVEAHGGTIRAESSGEGKGATFVVELPSNT